MKCLFFFVAFVLGVSFIHLSYATSMTQLLQVGRGPTAGLMDITLLPSTPNPAHIREIRINFYQVPDCSGMPTAPPAILVIGGEFPLVTGQTLSLNGISLFKIVDSLGLASQVRCVALSFNDSQGHLNNPGQACVTFAESCANNVCETTDGIKNVPYGVGGSCIFVI